LSDANAKRTNVTWPCRVSNGFAVIFIVVVFILSALAASGQTLVNLEIDPVHSPLLTAPASITAPATPPLPCSLPPSHTTLSTACAFTTTHSDLLPPRAHHQSLPLPHSAGLGTRSYASCERVSRPARHPTYPQASHSGSPIYPALDAFADSHHASLTDHLSGSPYVASPRRLPVSHPNASPAAPGRMESQEYGNGHGSVDLGRADDLGPNGNGNGYQYRGRYCALISSPINPAV
jgi:hypothetical protein